jgi:hypothetical protein
MLAMIGDCEGAGQVDRMSKNGGFKATETALAYVEQHKEWGSLPCLILMVFSFFLCSKYLA